MTFNKVEELEVDLPVVADSVVAHPWSSFSGLHIHLTKVHLEQALASVNAKEKYDVSVDLDGEKAYFSYDEFKSRLLDKPAVEGGCMRDKKRLDFLTEFGATWSVQWQRHGSKTVRYRMVNDGEAWGKWYSTPRAAIDAAMQQHTEGNI